MRHKWNINISWPGSMPESVYQIDQCITCGLYRLHKHTYAFFFKSYLQDGVESEQLSTCKPTKILS